MLRVPMTQVAALTEPSPNDLTPELRLALVALEVLESRFESDRECLEGWCGPDAVRKRLLGHLEARHTRERQLLVRQLAELHQNLTLRTMFRNVRLAH